MFDILTTVTTLFVSPSDLSDWLIARGQHFVTTEEVARIVGVEPKVVPISLQRAREARKLVSVTKGAWVPVPPEYRAAGAPPALHYIDPLMRHLGHPYYVGLLTAARLHGASHQVPMVVQIITPALLRDRWIGRSRLEFLRRSATAHRPTIRLNVPTGRITVSTPAVTVLDLVEAPLKGGGLGNVATVIGDMLELGCIDVDVLAEVAAEYPSAIAQRTGYLIEHMAEEVGVSVRLERLQHLLAEADYTPLDPQRPRDGHHDCRWHVTVNTEIEHDL